MKYSAIKRTPHILVAESDNNDRKKYTVSQRTIGIMEES